MTDPAIKTQVLILNSINLIMTGIILFRQH